MRTPPQRHVGELRAGREKMLRIVQHQQQMPGREVLDNGLRQVAVTVTYRPMTGMGLSAAGTAKASTVTMYVAKR